MAFLVSDLIARARVYTDDDHADEGHWIADERWLDILNTEWRQLFKRLVRTGLITVKPTDTAFTGPTTAVALTNVLAIIGVAEDLGGGNYRTVAYSQPDFGRPFWSTANTGPAQYWDASGAASSVTVELHPPDTGSYVARYVQHPTALVSSDSVDVPYGCDERLVLGMVKRAHLKDSGASRVLEDLIREADAEIGLSSMGRGNGWKVRRVNKTVRTTDRFGAVSPLNWLYIG